MVGFLGVIAILKPGLDVFEPRAFYALLASVFMASASLVIREQAKRDSPYVCMFYYFFIAFVLSGIISIFEWSPLDSYIVFLLIGIGVFGTLYQEFLIRGSGYASAKVVSSLMYSSLIFSVILDWLFFQRMPDFLVFMGIFLICIGGLLTVHFSKIK
jgi:drug/metabolite transporter (DMT)-like permease